MIHSALKIVIKKRLKIDCYHYNIQLKKDLQIKLFSVFTIADTKGKEIEEGDLLRR